MVVTFYQLPEVAERLRKSEEEVKELVKAGKLCEFCDNGKVFFKVNEVDALAVDRLQLYIAEIEKKLRAEIETRSRAEAELEAEAEERLKAEQRAKAEAQESTRAYEEALAKAQEDTEAKAKAISAAQEEISAYKEKMAKIKAEASGAITDQKKQLEARAAEAIAAANAEAADAITKTRVEFEQKARAYAQARDEAQAKAESEAKLRAEVEEKLREQTEENEKLQEQVRMMRVSKSARETGICECCNTEGIPKDELVAIDSGHLFCPNCLEAFRQCVQAST